MSLTHFWNQDIVWDPTGDAWAKYWKASSFHFDEFLEKSLLSNDVLNAIVPKCCVRANYYCLLEEWVNLTKSEMPSVLTADVVPFEAMCWTSLKERKNINPTFFSDGTLNFQKILDHLRSFPALLGDLSQYLKFRNASSGKNLTRHHFIERHLMDVPQFRELLELSKSELGLLWKILAELIEAATSWLWKRFGSFLKALRKFPKYALSFKVINCDREKLWPLLMAFKNN